MQPTCCKQYENNKGIRSPEPVAESSPRLFLHLSFLQRVDIQQLEVFYRTKLLLDLDCE